MIPYFGRAGLRSGKLLENRVSQWCVLYEILETKAKDRCVYWRPKKTMRVSKFLSTRIRAMSLGMKCRSTNKSERRDSRLPIRQPAPAQFFSTVSNSFVSERPILSVLFPEQATNKQVTATKAVLNESVVEVERSGSDEVSALGVGLAS
ncbi:hypothetical protein B296_00005697 [Ensete ventricosum]|uniref:Uncharacterized protein n=1 Tax=Ensete ventricosum TaxID=4639 RepID=A0A426XVX1_ENSVE|nr:hypothetical protein B296_00005697 [Ensete ventricosum]